MVHTDRHFHITHNHDAMTRGLEHLVANAGIIGSGRAEAGHRLRRGQAASE